MVSIIPVTHGVSTDSVFSKVFAHLPNSLREEKLGYAHSAPVGHLKHEPTPALEYSCHMLKNGSFKLESLYDSSVDRRHS